MEEVGAIPEKVELEILNIISKNCDNDAIGLDGLYIITDINKLAYDIYKHLIKTKNV